MNSRRPLPRATLALVLLQWMVWAVSGWAQPAQIPPAGALPGDGQTLLAHDTLNATTDSRADCQACLQGLIWEPGQFPVTLASENGAKYDKLVRFPSAVPSDDQVNDLVAVEWYAASDEAGEVRHAPAVLVVHESGSAMIVGRLFARSFQARGIHGFLVQLPYYGKRRRTAERPDIGSFPATLRQAVADVRRARDAVAVLPYVETRQICVQGTSLGGFVVCTAASLDGCFDKVFIMMAGGNLVDVIHSGQKDAAKVRRLLREAGYSDDQLKQLLWQIEPTRLAHRLDPANTWLYSARHDQVVPMNSARALAQSARLDPTHHRIVEGNHYTAISHFPLILQHAVEQIQSSQAVLKESD